MGLKYSAHSSSVLNGLSILPVSVSIAFSALTFLKSCFQRCSNTCVLYRLLLKRQHSVNIEKIVLGHVDSFLHTKNISRQSYMLNDNVSVQFKRSFYINGQEGLITGADLGGPPGPGPAIFTCKKLFIVLYLPL